MGDGRTEKKVEKKLKKKVATLAILLCSSSSSCRRFSSLPLPLTVPLGAVRFQMSLKNKMVAADGHTYKMKTFCLQ